MANLLLISDIPRLNEIFTRLTGDSKMQLRLATSLEKGDEELAADKPDIVFVQTHLSGLSADILLMHLKKQLGRKRAKFVLLSNPAQAGEETLKLYQGQLDISLDDEELLAGIRTLIAGLLAKGKKNVVTPAETSTPAAALTTGESTVQGPELPLDTPPAPPVAEQQPALPAAIAPESDQGESSLVEQGLTYAPRSRLSVYSEFNSSFDSAVDSIPTAERLSHMPAVHDGGWQHEEIEEARTDSTRSKRATFLLWLAPVVVAVVVVTMLQHRRSQPSSVAIKPETKPAATSAAVPADVAPPLPKPAAPPATVQPAPAAPVAPVAAPGTTPPAKPPASTASAAPKPATDPNARLGDRAVISAIAENRGARQKTGGRPTALPDFIPRSGHDKSYGAANPGWERYKGQVTEFKVFREGEAIKAIQIVDRGGKGIPESFMKGVLTQVAGKNSFARETSEKKDGYEIQRGHISDGISVVLYRDEQGGRLRAFVVTWQ